MSKILNEICDRKKYELEILKSKCSIQTLKKLLPEKKNRKFNKIIELAKINKKSNIIAEIKKSSPSAGTIIEDYHPEKLAINYEKAGAGATSQATIAA